MLERCGHTHMGWWLDRFLHFVFACFFIPRFPRISRLSWWKFSSGDGISISVPPLSGWILIIADEITFHGHWAIIFFQKKGLSLPSSFSLTSSIAAASMHDSNLNAIITSFYLEHVGLCVSTLGVVRCLDEIRCRSHLSVDLRLSHCFFGFSLRTRSLKSIQSIEISHCRPISRNTFFFLFWIRPIHLF